MNHNLTKACHECPYVGNIPGWIGSHRDPLEFVVIAKEDMQFPCHSSIDYEDPEWETRLDEAEQCVGQLAFMNKLCKRSREPEVAAHQERVRGGTPIEVLWPPEHLVAVHRAGLIEGTRLKEEQKVSHLAWLRVPHTGRALAHCFPSGARFALCRGIQHSRRSPLETAPIDQRRCGACERQAPHHATIQKWTAIKRVMFEDPFPSGYTSGDKTIGTIVGHQIRGGLLQFSVQVRGRGRRWVAPHRLEPDDPDSLKSAGPSADSL